MKRNIIITGGAGFIGSHVVRLFVNKYPDYHIINVDKLTYAGNLANLADIENKPNYTFIKADICDFDRMLELIRQHNVDGIIHLAAESHVDRSITNPRLFLETNILGTQNLLECAREAWVAGKDEHGRPLYRDGKKFLQISTDEVYGSLPRTPGAPRDLELAEDVARVVSGRDDLKAFGEGLFTEDTPLAPRSPYSASKTSADLLTLAYHETYGLPVNITRCSNN